MFCNGCHDLWMISIKWKSGTLSKKWKTMDQKHKISWKHLSKGKKL